MNTSQKIDYVLCASIIFEVFYICLTYDWCYLKLQRFINFKIEQSQSELIYEATFVESFTQYNHEYHTDMQYD